MQKSFTQFRNGNTGTLRLKILITIPHAFLGRVEKAMYGSEGGDAEARAAALLRCVSALHQTFGMNHRLIGPEDAPCNAGHTSLTIVVVTSGSFHLMGTLPNGLAHHHDAGVHPRLLGFACHAVLKANLGHYDWYGYVEDDIEVTDALLFDKLGWFNAAFGPKVMLQPNRYEVSSGPVPKLFIDGVMQDQEQQVLRQYQDVTTRPRLLAPAFGRMIEFSREINPHSGCFFADAAQMDVLAAHPEFGLYSEADRFSSPLETAATMPPMRCFELYKPSRQNASFLEVRHLHQRFLDRQVHYRVDGEWLRKIQTVDPL